MIWLFALGVIWLSVVHEGFRKVCFWIGGVAISGAALYMIDIMVHHGQL
jgi:hypothetical protein